MQPKMRKLLMECGRRAGRLAERHLSCKMPTIVLQPLKLIQNLSRKEEMYVAQGMTYGVGQIMDEFTISIFYD